MADYEDVTEFGASVERRLRSGQIRMHTAEPTMTCSKCGLGRVVIKSPEATAAWFKKWHFKTCDGTPVYQAGFIGVVSPPPRSLPK